jgi:hypothetical protein
VHYANNCPKRRMQTPQKGNGQKPGQPSSQAHTRNSNTPGNQSQQNYVRSIMNNMAVEQARMLLELCWVRFSSTLYLQ